MIRYGTGMEMKVISVAHLAQALPGQKHKMRVMFECEPEEREYDL